MTPALALPVFTDSFTCASRSQALRVNTQASPSIQFNPTSYDVAVEFIDGSTIAQASPPNMKGPIAYALSYPERIDKACEAIDWSKSHTWNFSPIDNKKYPAVELAKNCGRAGGGLPAIYNAANEVAVAAFLASQIKFTAIIEVVERVVSAFIGNSATTIRDISDVSGIEQSARIKASEFIKEIA